MLSSRSSLSAAGVALAAILVLAGCSAAEPNAEPTPSKEPTVSVTDECTDAGAVSDAVTVEGEFGAKPTVTFDAPLSLSDTERSVAIEGSGEQAKAGSIVSVNFTVYHGGTGEEIDSTGYGEGTGTVQIPVDEVQYLEGIVRALNCASVGERVVAVIPPADGFGAHGNADFGVTADDSMVFVFDVLKIEKSPAAEAAEAMVLLDSDDPVLPIVERADDGHPTVKIPTIDAPGEPTLAILEEGDGDVIPDGASVEVDYSGVNWTSGEEFDSSWKRGTPATFSVNQVVTGFGGALIGQKVGTKLIVVIPPAYGYGANGNANAGIAGTDTIVFVVDIRSIAAAQ